MVKLYSYGKINLFLNIEGKLQNGYHLIKTIIQSIDLHDELFIEKIPGNEIIIKCTDTSIPTDNRNTCYKAASIIKEKYKINSGIIIKINKIIPSEAGLAGGSSNGAAVIKGLNELWKLSMTNNEMLEIGLKIGADVPFCIMGGTYLAEGIGEKLTKLEDFIWNNILIVKPHFSMSTAYVYKKLSPLKYNLYPNNEMSKYIEERKYADTAICAANTLERVVEEIHPEINAIKCIMNENHALSSMMTGSGSAIFGLFPDKSSMDTAFNVLIKTYDHTYRTKTIDRGTDVFV